MIIIIFLPIEECNCYVSTRFYVIGSLRGIYEVSNFAGGYILIDNFLGLYVLMSHNLLKKKQCTFLNSLCSFFFPDRFGE